MTEPDCGSDVAAVRLKASRTEGGWLLLSVDTTRYQEPSTLQCIAEEILDDMRGCPPAP